MYDYTPSNPMNRIVCSAIRFPDGLVVCGVRHCDIIMGKVVQVTKMEGFEKAEQGFVDVFGNFVSRSLAWQIAKRAQQIHWAVDGWGDEQGVLFSEHLYRPVKKDFYNGIPF